MEGSSGKKGISWGYLIIGILFILTSLFTFYNPGGNLMAFGFVFAILLILNGVFYLTVRRGGLLIVAGILDILLGIFMVFNMYVTVVALPYIFAIWFIFDSLFRLLTVGRARAVGTGYFWISLILSILGVIVGVLLLFNPVVAALSLSFLVGFYLMMVGVECVVFAFSRR